MAESIGGSISSALQAPAHKPMTSKGAAWQTADNEFLAALYSVLSRDPLAALGAIPSRTTQMPYETNVAGSYSPPQKQLGRFEAEHVNSVRPDLAGGDFVALRRDHNPAADQGATVAHEYGHRGMEMLGRGNSREPFLTLDVLPTGGRYDYLLSSQKKKKNVLIDEEIMIRLLDYALGRDRPGTVDWLGGRGIDEGYIRGILADKRFMDAVANLWKDAYRKRIGGTVNDPEARDVLLREETVRPNG